MPLSLFLERQVRDRSCERGYWGSRYAWERLQRHQWRGSSIGSASRLRASSHASANAAARCCDMRHAALHSTITISRSASGGTARSPSSRRSARINAIAAVSASDVWAVGTAPTSTDTALILHWNGTAWSVVLNPTNGIPLTNLAALSVISANDIWAVGSGLIGDESATATLH